MSYRRADGLYGVGWLAERLRSLDSITGVETAFHDAALRAGDDFPTTGSCESLRSRSNRAPPSSRSSWTAPTTRLRDRQPDIEKSPAELSPRSRANALPRLVANVFDDGGWGFRIVLATPMIVAIGGAVAIQLADLVPPP